MGKVYAAEMLLNAHINDLCKEDSKTFLTMDSLFHSKSVIKIAQGCFVQTVTVNEAAKIFKLNKLRRKAKGRKH